MEDEKILRVKGVLALTGISRATLWRLRQSGDFPPAIRLSKGVIGWKAGSIKKWIDGREVKDENA